MGDLDAYPSPTVASIRGDIAAAAASVALPGLLLVLLLLPASRRAVVARAAHERQRPGRGAD